MARRRIAAGELGGIQLTRLANGTWRARARARDDAGELHQLRAVADTEDEARAEIARRAANLSSSGYVGLTASDTVADACTAWLAQVRVRAQAGAVSFSTYESYEQTARLLLVPRCGGITLGALTVGRCDRIIQAAFLEQSLSAARRVRSVLGLVCGYAVRDDAIPFNPVRDVQRLPLPEKKTAVLTAPQIAGIRELMERWREESGMGPRPNYRALIDGMDIMLGTSARVGGVHRVAPLRRRHDHEPADAAHRRHHHADPRAGRATQERAEAHTAAPQDRPADHVRRCRAAAACACGSRRRGAAVPDRDWCADERE